MSVNTFSGTPAVPTSYGFTAGKNAIINGDFYVNQRNFSSISAEAFMFDRFYMNKGSAGGTSIATAQTFTPGTAPVAGYEGANYLQIVSGSQSGASDWSGFSQRIENVRTYAGQTVTVSFWAKAASGTPKVGVTFEQNFGSGGSSAVYTTGTPVTISTSWTRYTTTVTLPALTGKTIGTGSTLIVYIFNSTGSTLTALGWSNTGLQNGTFSYWGVQVEAGSVATAFQTATGTLPLELAACQRYYLQNSGVYWYGAATATNIYGQNISFPVTMRTSPTITMTNLSAANFPATSSAGLNINTLNFTQARTASGTGGASFGDSFTASAEL